jgi:hypothetical protein
MVIPNQSGRSGSAWIRIEETGERWAERVRMEQKGVVAGLDVEHEELGRVPRLNECIG